MTQEHVRTIEAHASGPEPLTTEIDFDCLLRPGNTNCGGCGMSTGLTFLGRVLAANKEPSMLAIPACCGIVTAGGYPTTSYGVPTVATTFAASAAVASGLAAVRDLNEERGQIICWAGDGGTYDIGLATVSAAAERNEDIIYICYDNEIYGNTGVNVRLRPQPERARQRPRAVKTKARKTSWRSWQLIGCRTLQPCRLRIPTTSSARFVRPSRPVE